MRRAAAALAQRAACAVRDAARNGTDAASATQRRGAAAAAKRVSRPPQQTYTPPKGGNGAAQEAQLTAEELAARERNNYVMAGTMLTLVGYGYYVTVIKKPSYSGAVSPKPEHLVNWSGTHECRTQRFHQPETQAELEATVKAAHEAGRKLRCVGSGLSPNGLGFNEGGMVSLALMDRILKVDEQKQQVTVQAGARVQAVADELRKHGLSLQNYASIREQTIGGFTQVSAHGTGALIPPVDEQVVAMKLVTPALGTIELSKTQDPELFELAKVGLGCLGVVAEVTLQCVPAHRLLEQTSVASVAEVQAQHAQRLKDNKHLRYMWLPHTDSVVVVTCNEVPQGQEPAIPAPKYSEDERLAPLRTLLSSRPEAPPAEEVQSLSATQLRDALLALGPLDCEWVKKVNAAEAQYWRRCEGSRVGWSDEILGFDCGGQQWVLETAFPTGTADKPDGSDLAYMKDLLRLVEVRNVAAPAPIEQRWTAGSSARMSPAAGPPGSLHSWVGIIMYLPDSPDQRQAVTDSFRQYGRLVEQELMAKYNATEHWAKIEVPAEAAELAAVQRRLAARYPTATFAAARRRLDPKNVLGSSHIDALMPRADS